MERQVKKSIVRTKDSMAIAHAKACECREIPESIRKEIRKRRIVHGIVLSTCAMARSFCVICTCLPDPHSYRDGIGGEMHFDD